MAGVIRLPVSWWCLLAAGRAHSRVLVWWCVCSCSGERSGQAEEGGGWPHADSLARLTLSGDPHKDQTYFLAHLSQVTLPVRLASCV
jgi:hypothetical protein